jgi:hypothetical protein
MSVTDHLQDTAASIKPSDDDEFVDELHQPIWSVISFDRREAAGLEYSEAFRQLEELEAKGVAGLCVVTGDAAARIDNN